MTTCWVGRNEDAGIWRLLGSINLERWRTYGDDQVLYTQWKEYDLTLSGESEMA
jgi:hypothetical protein